MTQMSESPRKLLVVDDDEDFAESLAHLLEEAGHHVVIAHSGDEAIERCRDVAFDVALMDVRMPGKNGVESLREIRAIRPHQRAIMMTGYALPELMEQAVADGAWQVLSKPLDLEQLLDAVQRCCSGLLVVIADDDPDLAESLADAVEAGGHRVTVALDGKQAVKEVCERDVDVLVLDLRLPQLSGVEVVRELDRRGRRPLVIAITAYYVAEEQHMVAELRASDVRDVLEKPFDPETLVDLVGRVAQS